MSILRKLSEDESGSTAIEYGLIVGILSVAVIGAMAMLGTQLTTYFNWIAEQLAAVVGL